MVEGRKLGGSEGREEREVRKGTGGEGQGGRRGEREEERGGRFCGQERPQSVNLAAANCLSRLALCLATRAQTVASCFGATGAWSTAS
jgi:hypothetical protein